MVRKERFELSRSCERQPLKLVRLPVPPLSLRWGARLGSRALHYRRPKGQAYFFSGAGAGAFSGEGAFSGAWAGAGDCCCGAGVCGCGAGADFGAGAGAGDRYPPINDDSPRLPAIPSAIAPIMKRAPRIEVALVSTVARAERRLTASAAERARHIAALALLQQHHQQEEQAAQDVQDREQIVKHKTRF